MVFLRILGLVLRPAPKEGLTSELEVNGVKVTIDGGPARDDGRWYRAVARVRLERYPKRTRAGLVVMPDHERQIARTHLESAANIVCLGMRCARALSSPNPYAAFEAESDAERAWLAESSGLDRGLDGVAIGSVHHSLDMEEHMVSSLLDRLDGVELLAEAFSAGRATGQFLDFVRTFERAFQTSASRLVEPLRIFLDPRFGYTDDEIRRWTTTMRGSASHADRRNSFLVDSDIRPDIARVEQAAWDVLMNKAHWRSADTERRSVWSPAAGTTAPDGTLVAAAGSKLPLSMQFFDRWREFPLDLETNLRTPETWWPRRGTSRQKGAHSEPSRPQSGTRIQRGRRLSCAELARPNERRP